MIRITLGDMPSLLREMVASTLASQPDFLVTGESRKADGPEHDVLLLFLDPATGTLAMSDLLRRDPPAIVALHADGEQATVVQVECQEHSLAPRGDLCGLVRQAAHALQGHDR